LFAFDKKEDCSGKTISQIERFADRQMHRYTVVEIDRQGHKLTDISTRSQPGRWARSERGNANTERIMQN
jgi:hypothetical protein